MASAPAVHTKSIRIVAKGRGSDGKFFLALKIAEPGSVIPRSRLLSIADYKSNRTETETALGLPIVSQKAGNEFRDRVQKALRGPDKHQAQIGADFSRSTDARRIVDRNHKGQSSQLAYAWDCHQPTAGVGISSPT